MDNCISRLTILLVHFFLLILVNRWGTWGMARVKYNAQLGLQNNGLALISHLTRVRSLFLGCGHSFWGTVPFSWTLPKFNRRQGTWVPKDFGSSNSVDKTDHDFKICAVINSRSAIIHSFKTNSHCVNFKFQLLSSWLVRNAIGLR